MDLGLIPLADELSLIPDPKEEPGAPLSFVFCTHCYLAQIREDIEPEVLFGRDYPYYSSSSPQLIAHFEQAAGRILDMFGKKKGKFFEIASNDGVMLRPFKNAAWEVLGVDPARGPSASARDEGLETITGFFDSSLADSIREKWGEADVIAGNNVLAHVPDPNELVKGTACLMKDSGIAVFEFPYLPDLVENIEFDTIFHQHYSYYSLHSVKFLFERHGLVVLNAERIPIHGGSLRLTVGKQGICSAMVHRLLETERTQGYQNVEIFQTFSMKVEMLRDEVRALLDGLKGEGKRIAGYGAAGKANTLMAYCGIGGQYLVCIGDISSYKQGKYFPGNHLPIVSPAELLKRKPDYIFILAWNFREAIMRQFEEFHQAGGRFIIPLPETKIL
jgi:SAM-dependent methyltransferase